MQMLDACMHPRNLFPEQQWRCYQWIMRFIVGPFPVWSQMVIVVAVVVCSARNGPINNVALKVLHSRAGVHFN